MNPIRIVLADDQVMIRAGLRTLLGSEPDLDVVAEVGDGQAALTEVRTNRPDVVVMDIRMPILDGVAATRAIAADPELAGVRVLILTTFDEDALVFDAIRAGAAGFLLKDADPAELLRGIRVVAAGDALLGPQAARRLVAAFASTPPPSRQPPGSWVYSPSGSARSSPWSGADCPMRTLQGGSRSARPPPAPTCRGPWSS